MGNILLPMWLWYGLFFGGFLTDIVLRLFAWPLWVMLPCLAISVAAMFLLDLWLVLRATKRTNRASGINA